MKQRNPSVSLQGGSSLLVVFAVLCLTVLAMLSLSTALAQQRLSDSAIGAITGYHQADLEAQTIFAQLRAGQMPETVEQNGDIYRYACPISPRQTLHVQLQLGPEGWSILRWQAEAEDIRIDDSLPVWNKENAP